MIANDVIMLPITAPCWPTKRWGYSNAFAAGIFMELERTDELNKVQNQLCKEFGRSIGENKETYEVRFCSPGDHPVYVTFHDNKVYLGSNVRPYMGDLLPAYEKPKAEKV